MSALNCNRVGCANIMCYRLSDEYGYICWKCFRELVASGTLDIQQFMDTPYKEVCKPSFHTYNEIFPEMD